jgi:glutathione S-transferase
MGGDDVKLYTCGQKGRGGSLPGPIVHACGRAMKALDEAGHDYELEVVKGYRAMPWTRSGDARAEIRSLTGQDNVPVLLLDDGTAIAGSGHIVDWAKGNPAVG